MAETHELAMLVGTQACAEERHAIAVMLGMDSHAEAYSREEIFEYVREIDRAWRKAACNATRWSARVKKLEARLRVLRTALEGYWDEA